jgi:hypothetical protein
MLPSWPCRTVGKWWQDGSTATSRTLSLERDLFAARQYPHEQCDDVWSSNDCFRGDHCCGFPWVVQRHTVTVVRPTTKLDTKVAVSSFQTSPGSVCSIMMDVFMSGGTEEDARCLLVFYIVIRALHLVWGYRQPLGCTRASLVRVVGNLNSERYISQILRLVAVPYFWGLKDVIF